MGSVGNVCARAWLVICLTSCAEGFTDDPLATAARPGIGTGSGESGSASPDLGRAGMGATAQAGRMAYTGEACEMGETAECTCSPQGTPGTKSCRYDRASPTMGTFSECGNCAAPGDEMPDDPGDVMSSGSGGGTAVRAGSGGSAGRGGTGGSPGTGGSTGSSGSGGSGGTSGGTRGCMPACNNVCFPVGILPCCTTGGRCGCTWAPGAYCL